jgi:hypothetical protein
MWGCPVDGTDRRDEQVSSSGSRTRQCEFCYRELSESFLFCPYCGKRISPRDRQQTRWYHSTYAVVIGLATLGPFALPMIWSNPRYTALMKVTLTILTLAVTALLVALLVIVFVRLMEQIREVMNLY